MKILGRIALIFAASTLAASAFAAPTFKLVNLSSDVPGLANSTDLFLINPWGIASSPGGTYWIANQGSGTSTLYDGSGIKSAGYFYVPGPLAGGGYSSQAPTYVSTPTGMIWNPTTQFLVPGLGKASSFIFATEDGTIAAWASGNPLSQIAAVLAVDNSANGAAYKGIAYGNSVGGHYLYAANFAQGTIDVFGPNFAPVKLAGTFTDPKLPAGYAPFNVINLEGNIWVTYAVQGPTKKDDIGGVGNGIVNIFSTDGQFLARFASNGTLNSPWAIAEVPYGFSGSDAYAGMLLIGNFGDGTIHAYSRSGADQGPLNGTNGQPLSVPGLWSLQFGGGRNSAPQTLYLTAGTKTQTHGLFAALSPVSP